MFLKDIDPFVRPLVFLFFTSGDICPEFESEGGPLTLSSEGFTY